MMLMIGCMCAEERRIYASQAYWIYAAPEHTYVAWCVTLCFYYSLVEIFFSFWTIVGT